MVMIGRVVHYYNKIGVGIIKLDQALTKGDVLYFKGHTTDFSQKVEDLEINHQKVESANIGEEVGIKLDQPVREHDLVYREK